MFDEGTGGFGQVPRRGVQHQRAGSSRECSPVDLAANVRYDGTQKTVFPPYLVKKVGGVKVAFIGLTLTGTPLIVTYHPAYLLRQPLQMRLAWRDLLTLRHQLSGAAS